MPRYPAGQTASVYRSFLEAIAQSERDDCGSNAEIDRRRRPGKRRARFGFDRHVARVGQQFPSASDVEFETAVDDEAARILEMDSSRARSEPFVDVPENRVHDPRA